MAEGIKLEANPLGQDPQDDDMDDSVPSAMRESMNIENLGDDMARFLDSRVEKVCHLPRLPARESSDKNGARFHDSLLTLTPADSKYKPIQCHGRRRAVVHLHHSFFPCHGERGNFSSHLKQVGD